MRQKKLCVDVNKYKMNQSEVFLFPGIMAQIGIFKDLHNAACMPMIISIGIKKTPQTWREGTFWYPKESLLYLFVIVLSEMPWLRCCFPKFVVFNLCAVIKVYSTVTSACSLSTLFGSVRLTTTVQTAMMIWVWVYTSSPEGETPGFN